MLKIKNNNGEEIMRLNDDGSEEIFDKKLKEEMKQAAIDVNEKEEA